MPIKPITPTYATTTAVMMEATIITIYVTCCTFNLETDFSIHQLAVI